MYIVGYQIAPSACLQHDPNELVRYLRAASTHLATLGEAERRERGQPPLTTDDFLSKLQDKLRSFGAGSQDLVLAYVSPEGGFDVESPDPDEYVIIQVSTTSSLIPTIH